MNCCPLLASSALRRVAERYGTGAVRGGLCRNTVPFNLRKFSTMKTQSYQMIAALMAVSMFVANAWAQEPDAQAESDPPEIAAEEMEEGIPEHLQDAAFDQYIDMALLTDAWNRLEPAALADAGLQLAEGERVLFRSHKSVTADQVLASAVRVAGEKRDMATIERLVKAGKALGKSDLATIASAAQKLAGQARSAAPGPTVSLDKLSPVDFSYYKASVEGIETSRIRRDSKDLEEFATDLAEDKTLPQEIKQHLTRLTNSARSSIDVATTEQSDTLGKLLSPSRVNGAWYVWNGAINNPYNYGDSGVQVRVNFGTPKKIKMKKGKSFSAPLGYRWVQVLRSNGTWHGAIFYSGKYKTRSIFGVYYVMPF